MQFILDYDDAIHLDAEELAEGGIAEAYASLRPMLQRFADDLASVIEVLNDDAPSYAVRCGAEEFVIYSPELGDDNGNSWGRATVALFSIVNDQLQHSSHRFYAINGGNDLFGIFLTPEEAAAAQASLPSKADWPYLPKNEEPWFGMHH
jgi:hypothetical protein